MTHSLCSTYYDVLTSYVPLTMSTLLRLTYQGAIAARNALLPLSDPGLLTSVPGCTFTAPEVAKVRRLRVRVRVRVHRGGQSVPPAHPLHHALPTYQLYYPTC